MTRRVIAGPICSVAGIEVGIGENRKIVIDEAGDIQFYDTLVVHTGIVADLTGNVTGNLTGNVNGDVGSYENPSTVTGFLYGFFTGDANFLVSTEGSIESLPEIPEGQFAIFLMASDNTLVLKTANGVVGTIDVTPYAP